MINKKFIVKLLKDYQEKDEKRREIIALSEQVLHNSKKSIFALHRNDRKNAEKVLEEASAIIISAQKKLGVSRLFEEPSYKACLEEFVEANLFLSAIQEKEITEIKKVEIDLVAYLGGMCDMLGELARWVVNKAAERDFKEVKRIHKIANDLMEALIEFDMKGYLRTKYDQTKQALRKIEDVHYEVMLKDIK